MRTFKSLLVTWALLHATAPAFAAGPARSTPSRAVAPQSVADRYAQRCRPRNPSRDTHLQGTLLWGTQRTWDSRQVEEHSSVLVSVNLDHPREASAGIQALRLKDGHLVTSPPSASVAGVVLQGTTSDGKSVEVAVCDVAPDPEDPGIAWYRIEEWNAVAQQWQNPCVATSRVPNPRALAMSSVWDASGARRDAPGKFTFACENGAITKCVRWGYKPWESRDGKSLADVHQACTRMARADYCGDGRSHTHEETTIDMYDSLGVQARTETASAAWDPAKASFEAAWAPDGAYCLAHTRDGKALEGILKECPGRFQSDASLSLGQGDRCVALRVNAQPLPVLLRNRSYGTSRSSAEATKP
jgi:ADYC domain